MKYKYDKERGCMVDVDGFPMLNQAERAAAERGELCAPMIMSDIPDHVWNGKVIRGRAGQRELRKTDGVIPYEPISQHCRAMPKKAYDPNCDHWQSWRQSVRDKVAEGAGTTRKAVEEEMAARKAAGSLRNKVKLKAEGKKDTSIRTTIHGDVNNPRVSSTAACDEKRITISPEVREYAARRAEEKRRKKAM